MQNKVDFSQRWKCDVTLSDRIFNDRAIASQFKKNQKAIAPPFLLSEKARTALLT